MRRQIFHQEESKTVRKVWTIYILNFRILLEKIIFKDK